MKSVLLSAAVAAAFAFAGAAMAQVQVPNTSATGNVTGQAGATVNNTTGASVSGEGMASNDNSSASSGVQVAANAPDSAIPRRNSSEWLNQRELARLHAQTHTKAVAQATMPAMPTEQQNEQPG